MVSSPIRSVGLRRRIRWIRFFIVDLMDELNLNVCVLDAGSFAEDVAQPEVTHRTEAAILELQQNGVHVVVVNSHENLERLIRENTTGHDIKQCMLIRSYHDPSILDVLELAEHYDFSYYATAFDVDTICDWRAPPSTLNWLEKYREKLEIQCSFAADGRVRFIWPSQRRTSKWPVPKAAASKSTTSVTVNGKSYYPSMSESSGAGHGRHDLRPARPFVPPREEDIVRMSTGWISDSQRFEEELEMAVLPYKARGSLQLVLAILGHDEKNLLLQNASDMFQCLPMTDSKEEEDIQDSGSKCPWGREIPSHVIVVIGGVFDGLWAVGAGSRKRARIRAAKVALAGSVIQLRKIGAGFEERYSEMLHPLVERAKVLMDHARKVEVMQSASSWLTPDATTWLTAETDPVSSRPPSPEKQPFLFAIPFWRAYCIPIFQDQVRRVASSRPSRRIRLVEAGPHIGDCMLWAAAEYGPRLSATCVEPVAQVVSLFKRSIAANHFEEMIDVHHAFLGNKDTHEGGASIPWRRLDSLVQDDVDVFKIHTNGGERQILDGAAELFKNHQVRTVLVHSAEFHQLWGSAEFLLQRGYHVSVDGRRISVKDADWLRQRIVEVGGLQMLATLETGDET
eukprot:symbB.v1.2.010349.t1/scaffold675.1/size173442/7